MALSHNIWKSANTGRHENILKELKLFSPLEQYEIAFSGYVWDKESSDNHAYCFTFLGKLIKFDYPLPMATFAAAHQFWIKGPEFALDYYCHPVEQIVKCVWCNIARDYSPQDYCAQHVTAFVEYWGKFQSLKLFL